MDIVTAYRKVGTYRGAAQMCGTTHKTVRRVVGGPRPVSADRRARNARRTTRVSPSWSLVAGQAPGRISAKRLLPAAGAAGFEGRTTTSAVWSPRRRPSGGVSITAAGTPGCLWVRQAARAGSCGTWLLRLSSVIMTRHMWSASRRLRQRLASRGSCPRPAAGTPLRLPGARRVALGSQSAGGAGMGLTRSASEHTVHDSPPQQWTLRQLRPRRRTILHTRPTALDGKRDERRGSSP